MNTALTTQVSCTALLCRIALTKPGWKNTTMHFFCSAYAKLTRKEPTTTYLKLKAVIWGIFIKPWALYSKAVTQI